MLLQTNSYIVPRDKRVEHARLLRRFRQTLIRLGCDHFEVYEQVGANWNTSETTGRFVQLMRFHDRKHQSEVQSAERADPTAQALIQEFCELINFPYQTQQGLFAVGFYVSFLKMQPATRNALPSADAATEDQSSEIPSGSPEPGVPMGEESGQQAWDLVEGLEDEQIDAGEILGIDGDNPDPADSAQPNTDPLPIGKMPSADEVLQSLNEAGDHTNSAGDAPSETQDHSQIRR
jgi:hypothetical protein